MNAFHISDAIEQLWRDNSTSSLVQKLHDFVLKDFWSSEDRQTILNLIAECLTVTELTEAFAEYFCPILLDIFSRIAKNCSRFSLFCVLSKLIGHYTCATNFTYEKLGSGFFTSNDILAEIRNDQNLHQQFIEACFVFINFDATFFQDSFDWSFITKFVSHQNIYCRWISLKIYEILLKLDPFSSKIFVGFTEEESSRFKLNCYNLVKTRVLKFSNKSIQYATVTCSSSQFILDCDFSLNVISVHGILLERIKPMTQNDNDFILLPSVESNLQTAALGVSLGKPILVEGPMGCGKTLLIRHLASLTGREQPPDIMTIQISDQVDSKYLLGSYICSDIPGEFLFNLGPLLRAIQSGSWIILEDIDFASSDIIALVTSIIESKTASCIPGCENKIEKYDSNFRIFFTRRLTSQNNSEVNNLNLMNLLRRTCTTVTLSNLDLCETNQLILTKWPSLALIVPKIVEIYEVLLSSDQVNAKRFITLRDLLKWCNRLSKYFKLNSDEVSKFAFLDALDCFVSFSPNGDLILKKSLSLSSNLNITKSECEYMLSNRTPDISITDSHISIGRQTIERHSSNLIHSNFAFTTQSLQLLEKLFVCVNNSEAVLLCGETGVGKTSCIQYLASLYGKSLTVINMNQQSDSVELFGGYKPIDIKFLINSARDEYQNLFTASFDAEKNITFMTKFVQIYNKRDWKTLLQIMTHVCSKALDKSSDDDDLYCRWKKLQENLCQIQDHLDSKSELTFAFMEGALTRAVKEGHWVLLDEINLAEFETLQSLLAMLEKDASFLLFEKAKDQSVRVHKDFRLFACMNPATDIGKRELPIGIQNRFTEFFISEVNDKSQLRILVQTYIGSLVNATMVEAIVNFYIQVKQDSANLLKDINGYRPIYSLRNLCRALRIANANPFCLIHRSIYESFCLAFLSNLDELSCKQVLKLIEKIIFAKINVANLLKSKIEIIDSSNCVLIKDCPYPMVKGPNETFLDETYIRTATVQKNLRDICRIISAGKTLPILLQGETSVGKTSLITWLARATGNICFRVNNHEHTDLQEYVGSYCSDENGKIVFKEGVIVEAMRKGYWIILDELNLAPTEVLEALNRVLDDNRELFIPETQEVVKAHPRFLLFATQNPPGRYGGRKVLSRAFRNRFIELFFTEIPSNELETILHRKCQIPESYAKRMVSVLIELQTYRNKSDIFAGKHGLITLRDLFRWGYRYMKFAKEMDSSIVFFDWNKFLAQQGYMLLAGRVRKSEEMLLIKQKLKEIFKLRDDLSAEEMFYSGNEFENNSCSTQFKNVVWTKAFKRLGTLIEQAIRYQEPVLLVGETGCGKTTICQYFASRMNIDLKIVNCHMNTESADFLGSLRPNRNLSDGCNESLFEWVDGPLIRAMKDGSFLLVDEISLADDSVLERLNSVLEFERTIFLAESSNAMLIEAKPSFRYFATMNPGGDYGKKELSPALRDRFTEIWCPTYEDESDIKHIIEHNLALDDQQEKSSISSSICQFIFWFQNEILNSKQFTYSIRDILTWVNFINRVYIEQNCLNLREAFINGAFLVLIDSLGTCNTNTRNFNNNLQSSRKSCEDYLQHLASKITNSTAILSAELDSSLCFSVVPFHIQKGKCLTEEGLQYYWKSPGVQTNLFRIMRALQMDKPILLEGPPGVGKTSLVEALATVTGHSLIRINLSDQTDIADLFGCDLPLEGENSAGKFIFRDGPLLKALKSESTWILLDELNLASQTVLEGLNACLDHRGEIYIPELNRTFYINKTRNRIFASQNPFSMDGSRKGLPKSFLNRFTMVFIDHLNDEDFHFIISNLFPNISTELIRKMIYVNHQICAKVVEDVAFAKKGGPFEFNLRDLIRWANVTSASAHLFGGNMPERFFNLIYTNKMRTKQDREKIDSICFEEFGYRKDERNIAYHLFERTVQFGYSVLARQLFNKEAHDISFVFDSRKQVIESVLKCIEMNWMAILIGGPGVGKTFVAKMMANLCGQKLNIFSVNSEMDTTDLLGGFEQKDISSYLKNLEDNVLALSDRLLQFNHNNINLIFQFLSLRAKLKNFNHSSNSDNLMTYKVGLLQAILKLFPQDQHIENLIHELNYYSKILDNRQLVNGSFEWKDSMLIKCIERGEWLLIDNANLLNAAVLDRLNSLLENEGTLVINEKGSVDGKLTSVKAHPNFRLFLTMNPQYGELSRAMRNRGIEIVVPDSLDHQQIDSIFLKFGLCQSSLSFHDMDYSSIFRYIFETILKSQHGFHNECVASSMEMSSLLCLNHLITNSTVFYVLQDYFSLCMTNSITCTKLRIFLENSSVHDYSIRCELLNRLNFSPNSLQVQQQDIQIGQMRTFIKELLSDNFEQVKHLAIDFRENELLHNHICHRALLSSDDINKWNEKLNHYHLNLYWTDLMQKLATIDEGSLVAVAKKIAHGELNSKLYPQFIVPVFDAIQLIESEAVRHLLCRAAPDKQVVVIRNELLWCYQLIECCRRNNSIDWNQFFAERFFPLWFMFIEQIVPLLGGSPQLTDSVNRVNAILRLDNFVFNAAKFDLLKQLTVSYFQFKTSHDIELFERIFELCKLLKNTKSESISELNLISFQSANLLISYFTDQLSFMDASTQISQYCDRLKIKPANEEPSTVFDLECGVQQPQQTLVKSNLFLNSILYSKILNYFSLGEGQVDDIIALAAENSFPINPLLVLYSHIVKMPCDSNDIFFYLCMHMNQEFNFHSVIDYFGQNNSKSHQLNLFISSHLNSKSANLTVELLPLLSLTCFNIFQVEHISIEEFFNKSLTLDFYMNFLVQNYVPFKSNRSLFVENLIAIARTLHSRLIILDPTTIDRMQSVINNGPFASDHEQFENEVNKYFYLVFVGHFIASSSKIDFPIDPIIRSHVILESCETETSLIDEEVSLRLNLNQHKYGTNDHEFHSVVLKSFNDRLLQNKDQLDSETSLPNRVCPSKYFNLKSDVDQFCTTIFNLLNLQSICTDLSNCLKNHQASSESITRAISNSLNCQHSLVEFINHIERSYRNYHDLTSSFLTGVSLVLKGLQLTTFTLKSTINTREWFDSFDSGAMTQLFEIFFQFVNTHCPHEIGEFILQNDCITKFVNVASKLNIGEKPLVVSLLKSAFLEIENSIILGFNKKYLLSLYLKIVDLFVQWWKHEKQQEEMEKIKSEAIFHMKLEDEPDDAALRQVFPSFDDNFKDLIEDKYDNLDNNHYQSNSQDSIEQLNLSKETLLFVVRSHMKLTTLDQSHQEHNVPDFLKAYFIRYQLLSDIFKRTLGFVDFNLEKELIDGHILVNRYLTDLKGNNDLEDRPFNVYRESLVFQTRQCFAILEKLKKKIVSELLPQFENHPTLLKLLKVIDRIYKIEVNSSLLSFSTGLELILKTAEDWQLIAHRGISLIDHLNEITELLVDWRKMEIKYWAVCLDSVVDKIADNELVNWWFHFYTTLEDIERRSNEDEVNQFVDSVTRFVEKSTLGQFSVRLQILNCFVHQLKQSSDYSNASLLTAFVNLYNFYEHFNKQVTNAIEAERAPIEKEIKEFVKISKWNPNNFWSLKESLSKSHRQLYRYMKKFESALGKPANVVFAFDRTLKANTWKMSINLAYSNICSNFSFALDDKLQPKFRYLVDHKSFTQKSNKLCRKISKNYGTSLDMITKLEEANNTLIIGINEYSNLKVTETKDIDKWKKAVAQIQNKKRRALSDLFKQLTLYGLSFRKGFVHFEETKASKIISTIYPLVAEEGQFDSSASLNIVSCNTYFYKCLSGFMKFAQLVESPNPQLTLDMIDRIKGFTAELTQIVTNKRIAISGNLIAFCKLNLYLEKMNEDSTVENCSILNLKIYFDKVQRYTTKLLSFIVRLKSVITCLKSNDNKSISAKIPSISGVAPNFTAIDVDSLDNIIVDLKEIYSTTSETYFYTTSDLNRLSDISCKLSTALNSLRSLLEVEPNLLKIYSDHLSTFDAQIGDISTFVQQSKEFHQQTENTNMENFVENDSVKLCHLIIKNILLSVQNVFIHLEQEETKRKEQKKENDDYIHPDVNIDFIKQSALSKMLTNLNGAKIIALTDKFFGNINSSKAELGVLNYQLVCVLRPFYRQYMYLYRSILSLSFGSLKTVSKMLHIILSLFNELTANGFCLPPEPNKDQQENSQLKDIQDSGFGQGDTSEAQDVSDRLDCQDQLDELMKSEEQEPNEEPSGNDKDNEKGIEMDEDFEGDEVGNEKEEKENGQEEGESDNEENEFDDKMGNVDDDEDALDEKLWGDESEEEDIDDLNESEQTGGKDNIDQQMVADESNKDLKKNQEDNVDNDDEQANEEMTGEINETEMDDQYQNENPDKYKDNCGEDKPDLDEQEKMELSEDIQLDNESLDDDGSEDNDAKSDKMNDDEEELSEDNNNEDSNVEDVEMLQTDDTSDQANEENNKFDINTEDNPSEAKLEDNQPNVNHNDPNVANFDKQNSASTAEQDQYEQSEEQESVANAEQNSGKSQDKVSQNVTSKEDSIQEQACEEQSISKNNKNSRSLAEDVRKAKRQKIMHSRENNSSHRDKDTLPSDTYRHVDETNKANELAYDMAIPEECDKQQIDNPERGVEFSEEPEMDPTEDKDIQMDNVTSQKKETSSVTENDQQLDGGFSIEGEIVPTLNVARSDQSSFHTSDPRNLMQMDDAEVNFEHRLSVEDTSEIEACVELMERWKLCEQKIEPLVYELCNQLQLVLEPTKCAKFKGDYKSGKRLNMRKVIAYVASEFRKDKIWLRRSKPSKRQYQIIIAVDDSLSMADNQTKQMAFESLVLLGKSLSIIESGALSVLSFGEEARVLHSFNEPFTDQTPFKLFSKFRFDQQQTRLTELLQCSLSLFSNSRQNTSRTSNSNIYQLLLIVSDGRGINSAGNENLHRAILRLKELSIFCVFIIIDNPEHKNSIFDIKKPIFDEGRILRIESYMEKFPFPYYVVLKDINSLPSILGESLRQWFEMISYES